MKLKIAITVAVIFISLLMLSDGDYVACLYFVGSVLLLKFAIVINNFLKKK